MKIKKMKNSKTTKKKWELKMKTQEPLHGWIVNIMSIGWASRSSSYYRQHHVILFFLLSIGVDDKMSEPLLVTASFVLSRMLV